MSQLTQAQRAAQANADATGRALLTRIDGRIAIILPPVEPHLEAEWISTITAALASLTPPGN